MKKIIALFILSFLFLGCGTKEKNNPSYKEIMSQKEYVIIDVRTKEEYESGHIKDAIHIPYTELNEELSLSKEKNIFVYCKSGNRSKIAYDTLKNLGYTVYDLGGYENIDLPKE